MRGLRLTSPDPERWQDERIVDRCWIGCDPEVKQAVMWVGRATLSGVAGDASADVYACDVCLAHLYAMARAAQYERDRPEHLRSAS
ncbi:hypothetical protein [Streptomyces sp. SBT349]|uniref:hypothetical protein n=1 Tax=Streptomyces sp. SBT349 TaxID=1580539 RepID=UPI00066E9233|nr:hypothetical protein [Streptomyces sp. SBT349]